MQGFITNPTQVVGITSAGYTAILLEVNTTADAKSATMPQSGYLSHVEINADQTAGTTAQMRGFLAWNSSGDDLFVGPSALGDVAPGTTANRISTSIRCDCLYTAPTPQTASNRLYLFLRTDAGTVEVDAGKVRLQWSDASRR
jgi:hypothetical protein